MTKARAVACADKRNTISTAVAHSHVMPMTVPELTFNADGTSFETGGRLADLGGVKYMADDHFAKGGPLQVPAIEGLSLVSYFVKFYMFISAIGHSDPPIYILADSNMEKHEISVHKVKGFGIGTELDSCSYIVFCATRSANIEFYRWFFHEIFVKYVIKSRLVFELDITTPAYFCLDGESDQITPMKEDEIISVCREHNIIIGKPPASTTSQSQPLDAGKVFLSAKNINRGIKSPTKRCKFTNNIFLSRKLSKVLDDQSLRTNATFNPVHRRPFIEGIQQVHHLFINSLKPRIIIESFNTTGQLDSSTGECNILKILSQWKSNFVNIEIEKTLESIPQLQELMHMQGELFEKDYDVLKFLPSNYDKKKKDELHHIP